MGSSRPGTGVQDPAESFVKPPVLPGSGAALTYQGGAAPQLGSPQPPAASGGVRNRVTSLPLLPLPPRGRGASLIPHQTGCAFIL